MTTKKALWRRRYMYELVLEYIYILKIKYVFFRYNIILKECKMKLQKCIIYICIKISTSCKNKTRFSKLIYLYKRKDGML